MKGFHLFDLCGASTSTALCGRKLADPWTVDGGHDNVCERCNVIAAMRGTDPKKYSAIEDRGVSAHSRSRKEAMTR